MFISGSTTNAHTEADRFSSAAARADKEGTEPTAVISKTFDSSGIELLQSDLRTVINAIAEEFGINPESENLNFEVYDKLREVKKLAYRKLFEITEDESRTIEKLEAHFLAEAKHFSRTSNIPQDSSKYAHSFFATTIEDLISNGQELLQELKQANFSERVEEAKDLKKEQEKKEEKLLNSNQSTIPSAESKILELRDDAKEEISIKKGKNGGVLKNKGRLTKSQRQAKNKNRKGKGSRGIPQGNSNGQKQEAKGAKNKINDINGTENGQGAGSDKKDDASNNCRKNGLFSEDGIINGGLSIGLNSKSFRGIHRDEKGSTRYYGKIHDRQSNHSQHLIFIQNGLYVTDNQGHHKYLCEDDAHTLPVVSGKAQSRDEIGLFTEAEFKSKFLDNEEDTSLLITVPCRFGEEDNYISLPTPIGYEVSDIAFEEDFIKEPVFVRSMVGETLLKDPPEELFNKNLFYKLQKAPTTDLGVKYGDERFAGKSEVLKEARIFKDDSKMHKLLKTISPRDKEKFLLAYMRQQDAAYCDDPIIRSILNQCPNYLKAMEALGYYGICEDFQLAQELLFKQYGIQCFSLEELGNTGVNFSTPGHATTRVIEDDGKTRRVDSVTFTDRICAPRYYKEAQDADFRMENIAQAYDRGEISEEALYQGLYQYRNFLDRIHDRQYGHRRLDPMAYAAYLIRENDNFETALKEADFPEIQRQLRFHMGFTPNSTGVDEIDWETYKILRDYNKESMLDMVFQRSKQDPDFKIPEYFHPYFRPDPEKRLTCTKRFLTTIVNNLKKHKSSELHYILNPYEVTEKEKAALKLALSKCTQSEKDQLTKQMLIPICEDFIISDFRTKTEANKLLEALFEMEIFDTYITKDEQGKIHLQGSIVAKFDNDFKSISRKSLFKDRHLHNSMANLLLLSSGAKPTLLQNINKFLEEYFTNGRNLDHITSLKEDGSPDLERNPELGLLSIFDKNNDGLKEDINLYPFLFEQAHIDPTRQDSLIARSRGRNKVKLIGLLKEPSNEALTLISPILYEQLNSRELSSEKKAELELKHQIYTALSELPEYSFLKSFDGVIKNNPDLTNTLTDRFDSYTEASDYINLNKKIQSRQINKIANIFGLFLSIVKDQESTLKQIQESLPKDSSDFNPSSFLNLIRAAQVEKTWVKEKLIDILEDLDPKYSKLLYTIISQETYDHIAHYPSTPYSSYQPRSNRLLFGTHKRPRFFRSKLSDILEDLYIPSAECNKDYIWLQNFKATKLSKAKNFLTRNISDKVLSPTSKGWDGSKAIKDFNANKAGEEFREYVIGDPASTINHKASAKSDKIIVRSSSFQEKKVNLRHFILDLSMIGDYSDPELALASFIKEMNEQIKRSGSIESCLTLVFEGNILYSFDNSELIKLFSSRTAEGNDTMIHHSYLDKLILSMKILLNKLKTKKEGIEAGFKQLSFNQWLDLHGVNLKTKANEFYIMSNNSKTCFKLAKQLEGLKKQYRNSYGIKTMSL